MYSKIEAYNYKIHNYNKETRFNIESPFGNIEQNMHPDINMKISVHGTESTADPNVNNTMLLSIDPLNSINIRNKYYKKYKENDAKSNRTEMEENNKEIYSTILAKVNHNMENKLGKLVPPIKDIKRLIKDEGEDDGYIRKLEITNEHKVIIFGDHHGSYHTFFRNMLRLHTFGVINISTYQVNDNYKIVFLGDIIDRGQHSIEILEMLFRFILNDTSNDRIIICRGNHETDSIASSYGFSKEIAKAYNNMETSTQVFSDTMSFFKKCPTATIIKNVDSNHTFWLCHGFIPIYPGINQIIKDFIDSTNNILLPRIKTIMTQIRWNDPHHCNHISCIDDMNNTMVNYARGGGNINIVGLTDINKFIAETGIKFIIRGHNDSYANAILLCNKLLPTSENQIVRNLSFFELGYNRGIKSYSTKLIRKINLNKQYIDGSIENIMIKDDDWIVNIDDLTIYPVLTISTNTDIDRPFTCDSFIVLHTNNMPNMSLFKVKESSNMIKDYLETKQYSYIDTLTKDRVYYSEDQMKYIQQQIYLNNNNFKIIVHRDSKSYIHHIILSSNQKITKDNTKYIMASNIFSTGDTVIINNIVGVISDIINTNEAKVVLVDTKEQVIIQTKYLLPYYTINVGDTVTIYNSVSLAKYNNTEAIVLKQISDVHYEVKLYDDTIINVANYRLKKNP